MVSCERDLSYGVMEGGGAYNRHAALQAGGAGLVLPVLEQAARNLALGGDGRPVIIADYGSSQGKNSLAPMRAAVGALRGRLGLNPSIVVIHVDQAGNDFNTLFDVLDRDPDRYGLDDPKVFPCAVGRSFYESVLPHDYVHLGWSSYAVVWLRRAPMLVPGHFMAIRSTGEVRAAFERQGAEDWELFLSLRARELRPGGRLVVVLPGINDDGGVTGFEALFDHANATLAEMVGKGTITAQERERMVLPGWPRSRRDLLLPFGRHGKFRGLTVERCDLSVLSDPAWADYERDGNSDTLATGQARFFRTAFSPSLACALNEARDGACRAFADRLEDGLKLRLASQPAPLNSYVQTIVLAKQGQMSARELRIQRGIVDSAHSGTGDDNGRIKCGNHS